MKKTLAEWEKLNNCIVPGVNPRKKFTKQEFNDIPRGEKVGVYHAQRIEFLQANRYKVTRQNMIKDLSTRGTNG